MHKFIARFADRITGVLSGFDRVLFRGRLRSISYAQGLDRFLVSKRVLLKDFGKYAEETTDRVVAASCALAEERERPVIYLRSSSSRKEDLVHGILAEKPVETGLVCVLSCVEPAPTFELHRSRQSKRLELQVRPGKCRHLYHYFVHPRFGLMHTRLQTWFPFTVQVCLNGRLWLACQMDRTGLSYSRSRNCFLQIEDPAKAQRLANCQLDEDWPRTLDKLALHVNPELSKILEPLPPRYTWYAHQTEWATDLIFTDPAALADIYPAIVHHAITRTSCGDVMRFLGRRVHGKFQGEVTSDFKDRPEGVRVKHSVDRNSIKIYDKEGSVLRVESTVNDASEIQVVRPRKTDGKLERQHLRKSVADLRRRADACQRINERYLDHFAVVAEDDNLSRLLTGICSPTRFRGRPVRGLRPWEPHDVSLLRAINDAVFALRGFRNGDIVSRLYEKSALDEREAKSRRSRTTRQIQLLRAHGIVRIVPGTRRYHVSPKGRQASNAILAALDAPVASFATPRTPEVPMLDNLRHRDLAAILFKAEPTNDSERSVRRSAVTRLLQTLARFSLVERHPGAHRYALTPVGKSLIAAVLASRRQAPATPTHAA